MIVWGIIMANIFDVAVYITDKLGEISAMKLQKLVYYCQAWSLVWDDDPLFEETIQAWANGPVVPELYQEHKGLFKVNSETFPNGNPSQLLSSQSETIDVVLEYYGDKPSQWLSDLTHAEAPWRNARQGLSASERGNQEITWAEMAEYYNSIQTDNQNG